MKVCSIALLCVFALVANVGCNSVPLKQRVTQGLQTAHVTVSQAQDTEISIYNSGTVISAADHKAFHAALVKFFDAEIALAQALQVWRAGDPPPQTVREGLKVAKQTLTEAQKLAPASFQPVLGIVAKAIGQIEDLLTLLEGGVR